MTSAIFCFWISMNTCDIEPELRNTGLSILVWVAVFLVRPLVNKKYIHYCVYRKDVILKQLHHLETCGEWGDMLMIRCDSVLPLEIELWNCDMCNIWKETEFRVGFWCFPFLAIYHWPENQQQNDHVVLLWGWKF